MSLPISTARPAAPRALPARPELRLVDTGRSSGERAGAVTRPHLSLFVVCVTLLVTGLVAVLVLNTMISQNSYTLSQRQDAARTLDDQTVALRHDIDAVSSSSNLAAAAAKRGMGPVAAPMFLDPRTGAITGVAEKATAGDAFTVVTGPAAAVVPTRAPDSVAGPATSASGLGLGGGLVPAVASLAAR